MSAKSQNELIYRLMAMFPQACPDYLRRICAKLTFSDEVLHELIDELLSNGYPERTVKNRSPEKKIDPEEQFKILRDIFPDADPTYLRHQCDELADKPEKLKDFIEEAIKNKNYPSMKDFLRRQQLCSQQKQYTINFQVAKFLEIIPDPASHFKKSQAKLKPGTRTFQDVCNYLKNEFNSVPATSIVTVMKTTGTLQKAHRELLRLLSKKCLPSLKVKRKTVPLYESVENIPLLQEMAFLSHKEEILEYIKKQKLQKQEELKRAKGNGCLYTCNCCCNEEILKKDMISCSKKCMFCKQCVEKSVEVAFGEGRVDFACLGNCKSYFSLRTLQSALNPKLFSKVAQKKQIAEVKAAGIEDLEMCPFCDFASIPAAADKVFKCFNPECMKESCRQCKEPSHLPLKCSEVEKDDDVKRRQYVENKMSEALMKKCYQCSKPFIKSEGCNKITCPCGASQCYLCGKPATGYSHFNGPGGDKHHLCPLYSETEVLHEVAVLAAAETAKSEVENKLKTDPSSDVRNHYAELKKKALPLPAGVVLDANARFGNVAIDNLQPRMAIANERERRNRAGTPVRDARFRP